MAINRSTTTVTPILLLIHDFIHSSSSIAADRIRSGTINLQFVHSRETRRSVLVASCRRPTLGAC